MPIKADLVLCDDVRVETSGKFILVGVYPADMIMPLLPGSIRLSIFLRVWGVKKGEHSMKLSVRPPKGDAVVIEGSFTKEDDNNMTALPIAGVVLNILEKGKLRFSGEFDGEKMSAFTPIEVKVASTPQE